MLISLWDFHLRYLQHHNYNYKMYNCARVWVKRKSILIAADNSYTLEEMSWKLADAIGEKFPKKTEWEQVRSVPNTCFGVIGVTKGKVMQDRKMHKLIPNHNLTPETITGALSTIPSLNFINVAVNGCIFFEDGTNYYSESAKNRFFLFQNLKK